MVLGGYDFTEAQYELATQMACTAERDSDLVAICITGEGWAFSASLGISG